MTEVGSDSLQPEGRRTQADPEPGPDPGGIEPTTRPDRGRPLVATVGRWTACSLALGAAFAIAVQAFLIATGSSRTLISFAPWIESVAALVALLAIPVLLAEESRLARELRTARTGTPTYRATVLRRGLLVPLLGRLLSTKLGAMAVHLADGDRDAALRARAAASPLMRGGRLERLRAVVDADLERAQGGAECLDRAAKALRRAAVIGNREADLYRLHVLVKALLEQGDTSGAADLVGEILGAPLEKSDAGGGTAAKSVPLGAIPRVPQEERVYLIWLLVWFELDGAEGPSTQSHAGVSPGVRDARGASDARLAGARLEGSAPRDSARERPAPLAEGDLRLAALVARAQGAEKLVSMLEERAAAIAHPGRAR